MISVGLRLALACVCQAPRHFRMDEMLWCGCVILLHFPPQTKCYFGERRDWFFLFVCGPFFFNKTAKIVNVSLVALLYKVSTCQLFYYYYFEPCSDGHTKKKKKTFERNTLTALIYLACSQKPGAICYPRCMAPFWRSVYSWHVCVTDAFQLKVEADPSESHPPTHTRMPAPHT